MILWRKMLICVAALAAAALAGPAMAVACTPPSAGDQQYVDPLACSHHSSSGSHKPTPTTSTPAPSSSGTPTTPSATAASGSTPSTTTPTATTASTTTTTSSASAKTLPRTGYDAWLGAALGFVLVAGGFGLRLRARRA